MRNLQATRLGNNGGRGEAGSDDPAVCNATQKGSSREEDGRRTLGLRGT